MAIKRKETKAIIYIEQWPITENRTSIRYLLVIMHPVKYDCKVIDLEDWQAEEIISKFGLKPHEELGNIKYS